MEKEALQRAVAIFETQQALADALSAVLHKRIRQQHISNWLNRDLHVPSDYCPAIEHVTRKRIAATPALAGTAPVLAVQLRPDIFGLAQQVAVA